MIVTGIIACATCITKDSETAVLASNGAVFVMLGCMAIVFGAILAVVVNFIRRANRFAPAAGSHSSGQA